MLEPSLVQVLNQPEEEPGANPSLEGQVDAVGLSKHLHKALLKLKAEFMCETGTRTNFGGLRESPEFAKFSQDCQQLCLVDLTKLANNDYSASKAFFINIYNTLTIHALAMKVTSEKTVLQLEKFWQMYAYRIGSFTFSLDDIEHGVLRCNKLHPTYQDYFFKEGDPRRDFVLPVLDPRIHFALNCGAKSCPPIRLFSPDNLERGLDIAAISFCSSETTVDEHEKCVVISKIFQWYGGDFAADEKSIVKRITQYLSLEQIQLLDKLGGEFSVAYADYDWNIH